MPFGDDPDFVEHNTDMRIYIEKLSHMKYSVGIFKGRRGTDDKWINDEAKSYSVVAKAFTYAFYRMSLVPCSALRDYTGTCPPNLYYTFDEIAARIHVGMVPFDPVMFKKLSESE